MAEPNPTVELKLDAALEERDDFDSAKIEIAMGLKSLREHCRQSKRQIHFYRVTIEAIPKSDGPTAHQT